MAFRTMIKFNDPRKCLLTTFHCHKTFLEAPNSSRYVRGFKKLRDSTKQSESIFQKSTAAGSTVPSTGKLWKPLGFAILFGSAAHVGAAVWEYEKIRNQTYKVINQYQLWRVNRTGLRGQIEAWWRGLSDGQRVFAPICFLNIIVLFAWRVPALKTTMLRYFCADPSSSAICWPMVLSMFSHYSILHCAVNMYALHSFCTAAVSTLGKEQFVALYLTGGVVSSLASHFYKTAFSRPGLSLGASGAIMSIVGFVCMQFPETHLGIAFLPMITFTAGNAIKGLIAIDSLGCILGWRFLDHAAHLGGVAWGIFWQTWGNANLWQKREPVLSLWHSIREPPKSN